MGRLEVPQILLDMLWLSLDVLFVAGAGWIPQQLCSTRREGTGGAGMAAASRRPMMFGKPRKGQLEAVEARSGQSCSLERECVGFSKEEVGLKEWQTRNKIHNWNWTG